MPVQSVIAGRRLTMAEVPRVLPVVLPAHMPSGLPDEVARQVVALVAGQRPGTKTSRRPGRSGRSEVPVAPPRGAGALVVDQAECDRLVRFLEQVPDRHKPRGRRYRLLYVLAVALLAMTAGEVTLTGIAEWAATAPAELLIALGAAVDCLGRVRRPDTKPSPEPWTPPVTTWTRHYAPGSGRCVVPSTSPRRGAGCGTAACTWTARRPTRPATQTDQDQGPDAAIGPGR